MYPHCILTVPHCTLTVSPLYPPYTLNVSSFPPPPHPLLIPPNPTVPQLNPHCAPMYPHCIITVPHCTLTVSPLYPPCTLTVSSFPPTPQPLLLPPSSITNLHYHDHCFYGHYTRCRTFYHRRFTSNCWLTMII